MAEVKWSNSELVNRPLEIVRALAESEAPLAGGELATVKRICLMCKTAISPDAPLAHDPSCPWRMAKELVDKETSDALDS